MLPYIDERYQPDDDVPYGAFDFDTIDERLDAERGK